MRGVSTAERHIHMEPHTLFVRVLAWVLGFGDREIPPMAIAYRTSAKAPRNERTSDWTACRFWPTKFCLSCPPGTATPGPRQSLVEVVSSNSVSRGATDSCTKTHAAHDVCHKVINWALENSASRNGPNTVGVSVSHMYHLAGRTRQ